MMPNEGTRKKVFGDPRDEVGEALYRTAASILVNLVWVQGIDRFGTDNAGKTKWWHFRIRRWGRIDRLVTDNAIKTILNNKQLGEAVISFALAGVLELVPMPRLADDMRKRLAYNLRVRSYEKIPELGIRLTRFLPYIQGAAERALELAKAGQIGAGDDTSFVEPPPEASEAEAVTTDEKGNES